MFERDDLHVHEGIRTEAPLRRRRGPALQREVIFEQYLSRLPLALMFVSAAGAVTFETPDGIKQRGRWNRGLATGAESLWLLPQGLDHLITSAQASCSFRRESGGMASWSVRHPRHLDLHVRVEECRTTRDDEALTGYWMTFLQRPVAEEVEKDFSGNALAMLQELSPSERKVAALVARGMTNEQVAELITRSIRTVEYQLNSVYKKLGIKRRTQLAIVLN